MAIFRGPPDTAAQDKIAAQMGLVIVRPPEPEVEVWADHWQAVEVFEALCTQWTVAPTGQRIGLRYEPALMAGGVMDLVGVRKADRRYVFDCVRIMEAELLAHLADLQPKTPGSVH